MHGHAAFTHEARKHMALKVIDHHRGDVERKAESLGK